MSDEYEISDPYTIGGSTGQYSVPSPYHTECEWCIVSCVGVGTLGSAATFAIGSKNSSQPSLSGSSSFGSIGTSGPDSNNALPSYIGAVSANAPMVTFGSDNYMPIASPSLLFLTVTTPASTGLFVTVQFRRKLDRVIPDKPRAKPHTHTHVTGRRDYRTMMEGFAAQYPEEGVPYEHQPLPGSTATAPRQLKPTNVRHRGISNDR